jgi:hypothetical protein
MLASIHTAALAAQFRRMASQPRTTPEYPHTAAVHLEWDAATCHYLVRYDVTPDYRRQRPDTPPDRNVELIHVDLEEIDGREPTLAERIAYGYGALVASPQRLAELQDAVMAAHVGW